MNAISMLLADIDSVGCVKEYMEALALEESAPIVIVTRHAGAVEWLAQRGITGKVIAQASPSDVEGKIVIGNVPLYLAALAAKVGSIDMPDLRADQRGADLLPREMDAAGAVLMWYAVAALN